MTLIPRAKETILNHASQRLIRQDGTANRLGRMIAERASDQDLHRLALRAMVTRARAASRTGYIEGARIAMGMTRATKISQQAEPPFSLGQKVGRFEYAAKFFNNARRVYRAAR